MTVEDAAAAGDAPPPALEACLLSHRGAMAPVVAEAIASLALPVDGSVLDAGQERAVRCARWLPPYRQGGSEGSTSTPGCSRSRRSELAWGLPHGGPDHCEGHVRWLSDAGLTDVTLRVLPRVVGPGKDDAGRAYLLEGCSPSSWPRPAPMARRRG